MRACSGRADSRGDRGFASVKFFTAIAVIIGVVAGISSAYPGVRRSSHDKAAQSASRHAATAALAYRADHRTFDGMDAAAPDAIEPSLPDAAGEAQYGPPGGATYRSTAAGSAAPLP